MLLNRKGSQNVQHNVKITYSGRHLNTIFQNNRDKKNILNAERGQREMKEEKGK